MNTAIQKHTVVLSIAALLIATLLIATAVFVLTRGAKPNDILTQAQPIAAEAPMKMPTSPAPFFSQAPFGQWKDPRHQDGCEEASVLMAIAWAQNKDWNTKQANALIEDMAAYQTKTYGSFRDTSAQDTALRLLKGYFQYSNFEVQHNITVVDIRRALEAGSIVIIPMNGQKLNNPYYTGEGPERHMLVVIGYDPRTDQFITNDPGTRHGAGYRYAARVLDAAIRDYPSGDHRPITPMPTAMIIVQTQR